MPDVRNVPSASASDGLRMRESGAYPELLTVLIALRIEIQQRVGSWRLEARGGHGQP